jgi:hypothetical protein
VLRRFTHNNLLLHTAENAIQLTTSHHGSPSGSILGDEILRDTKPYLGSELCTVAETGYSLAYLYQATGNNEYADAAELVYFNALTAQVAHDGWDHQFMDYPNQPLARYEKGWGLFTTSNTGSATIYGLEPIYLCCTVNFPLGYSKLSTQSWARRGLAGIAHMLLGPSQINTQAQGHNVTIICSTNYPFSGTLHYTVDSDVIFDLYLRLPTRWHPAETTLEVNGTRAQPFPQDYHNAGMQKITLPEAFFNAGGVGMDYTPFAESRDWSYASTKPWNVAIDPKTLKFHGMGADDQLPRDPFVYENATTFVRGQGCEVDWHFLRDMTPDDIPIPRVHLRCADTWVIFR